MIKLKSKTLIEYYGMIPDDYNLKFIHYDIAPENADSVEYKNLESDLKNIFEYTSDFQIYFQNVDNFIQIINHTNILHNYFSNIFLRINNSVEYQKFKNLNIRKSINIIVNKEDLKILDPTENNITVQIDKINELNLAELKKITNHYNITHVLLGQIEYISKDNAYLFEIMSKMYHIKAQEYKKLEKLNKITNDIYDLKTYILIFKTLENILNDLKIADPIDGIYKAYEYIARNVCYSTLPFDETNIENQNLIGPLFKGISVCEGYSKLFLQMMSLLNIETIIVGGGGRKNEGGHLWNQVFIDGNWYNVDVTAHSYYLSKNTDLNTCLVADECLYYEATTVSSHKCFKTFHKISMSK